MEKFNAAEEKGLIAAAPRKGGGGAGAWEGRSGETAAGDAAGHR